ncbi:MAG: phage tail protein I [Firmicutes bacterium]|nr:phage tail protein I [[Eubacterium] siraeum]MCM1486776.1 phage tail protein I [Bacillota bacterium]
MSKLITEEKSLLGAFPFSLSIDGDKYRIAEAIAEKLAKTAADTEKVKIYPIIDELPEGVLDILAKDFKVEWYEYNAPLKNKRQAIKECILVHKYKGTKYAVETAVHSLYDKAEVKEWFEYEGLPYHFQIRVYGSSSGQVKTLNQKILYAKNLRSILDDIIFVLVPERDIEVFVGAVNTALHIKKGAEVTHGDNSVYTIAAFTVLAGAVQSGRHKRIFGIIEDKGSSESLQEFSAKSIAGGKLYGFHKKIHSEVSR